MNVLFEIVAHVVAGVPNTVRETSHEKAPLSMWALFFLSILLLATMLGSAFYVLTH